MFLRSKLNRVRHITLDLDGPGVVRIHIVPCHKPDHETPFTVILNGQDILPLNVSWAILLTNLIEALKPCTGKEIRPEEWAGPSTPRLWRPPAKFTARPSMRRSRAICSCWWTACVRLRGGEPPLTDAAHESLAEYARPAWWPPTAWI